jgi:transaldolase
VVANTVNTMPEKTMMAVADHGEITGDQVTGKAEEAQQIIDRLGELGISYDDVIDTLEKEGVHKFDVSWGELEQTVETALKAATEA